VQSSSILNIRALFDIEYGRQVLRRRPDLGLGGRRISREAPPPPTRSSAHALDVLWNALSGRN
jgi:hypothetical protein